MAGEIKIAVVIPTRGNRPEFLAFALKQLDRQTRKADVVILVDEPPAGPGIDIAVRYKFGFGKAFSIHGCDMAVCIEDDDYYAPEYIEWMERRFIESRRPVMLGISHTIYYNIMTCQWVRLDHPGRSSMMNMAVGPAILEQPWCADDYAYLDFHLWTKTRCSKISFHGQLGMCVSIKHGIGMVGGGGHTTGWKHYNQLDPDMVMLGEWVKDKDELEFYKQIHRSK